MNELTPVVAELSKIAKRHNAILQRILLEMENQLTSGSSNIRVDWIVDSLDKLQREFPE